MSRFKLSLTSLLMATALVVSMGIASSGATPFSAQTPEDISDESQDPIPAITPLAGIVAPSPTTPWLSEVRVPVVITNVTAKALPADLSALGDFRFTIQDALGDRHDLDGARPRRGVLPNHSLSYLDPAMAARWTLGFQVPTAAAANLILEVRRGGVVVQSWPLADLDSPPPAVNAAAMADATVALGDDFEWSPGVTAVARGVGSLLCGDPTIEAVTQVVAVTFDITNSTAAEVRWPGYVHRDGSSVAQWADGTAADMNVETYVGGEESLPRISTFAVRIPAMTTTTRAMVFAAPRDGRFTDPNSLPVGVMLLNPPAHTWLALAGASAEVSLSPVFCDLGFFGGPIPFGYTPGAKFEVGGETAPVDSSATDAAARSMITEALAGAALFYDANNQSFAGVAGDDLVARAPRISFESHDAANTPPGQPGVVYFAMRANDNQFLYVVTRSTSGRWFCAGVTPHEAVMASDSDDLAEITGVCFPTGSVEDG